MGHDIETWGEHQTPIMPVVNKQARKVASAYFEAYSVPLAQMICEDIVDNFHSHDARRRSEAKEMLVKMKDKIFQTKPGEVATAQIHGDIDEDTSNALNKFIEQKRLLDTTKGQVKENEDGATFSN
tara:strand:+ start:2067 stop:2444 length:378 start_codon:yes stop_codon:yes gene_type:complete